MWNKALYNGLLGGLIGVALTLLGTLTGINPLEAEPEWSLGRGIFMVLGFAIVIFFIHRAMIQYRDEANSGFMSYGQALGVGILTSIVIGVVYAAYYLLHYNVIDPSALDQMRQTLMEGYEESGLSEEEIESFSWMTDFFASPIFISIAAIFQTTFLGLIVSLIAAAVTKRDAPEQ